MENTDDEKVSNIKNILKYEIDDDESTTSIGFRSNMFTARAMSFALWCPSHDSSDSSKYVLTSTFCNIITLSLFLLYNRLNIYR